jgi:hypothetical protein
MGLRWEWRTFGEPLGAAGERLGSMPPEKVTESDETYLLAPASLDAVKARADLMDVKHLEAVDDDGLELWEPVMKAPLPVSAADAAIVLAALGVPVPCARRRPLRPRRDRRREPRRSSPCPCRRRGGTSRSAAAWRS